MSNLWSQAVGFVLILPVLAAIVWLPLRSGGTEQFPLIVVQSATFAALAVTAFRRGLRFPGPKAFWAALAVTLAAAATSTAFSKDLDASVPALMGWIWLGAVVVLVSSHLQTPAGRLIGPALVLAVVIQAFWGFFAWWGGGDPSDTQSGTFYSPNQYAGFLLLLAPLLITPALLVKPRREAAAWGATAAFVCLGVILSGSRGGMVALAIGVASTMVLAARSAAKKALIRSVLLTVSTVVIGLLLTSPLVLSDRSVQPSGGGPLENVLLKGSPSPSLDMRLHWVEGAVRIGMSQPLTGSGLGTYGDMLVQVQEPSWFWSRYAHNHYAESFAEGGILLLLGVIAVPLTVIVGPTVREMRAEPQMTVPTIGAIGGLLGGSAHLVIDHDWSFPAYAVAFMTLAALAITGSERTSTSSKTPWTPATAIGALCLLMLIATASRGLALHHLSRPENRSVGVTVTRLAPYSAEAHQRHCREMVREGNLNAASTAMEDAIHVDKLEPRLRWQAAEIYVLTGRLEDAEVSYLEAVRIAPNAPASYRYAAQFFLEVDEPRKAVEVLDRGIARLSESPSEDRVKGSIEDLAKLRSVAITRLVELLSLGREL